MPFFLREIQFGRQPSSGRMMADSPRFMILNSAGRRTPRASWCRTHQPEIVQLPYQKRKVLELLLYLYHAEKLSNQCVTEYPTEQIELIRPIRKQLLNHL